MNAADMTPRARWARAQVMPWLAAHPDGSENAVTLTCQRLDDMGALLDLDLAVEIAADARAEAEQEVERLKARETELLAEVAALQAQNEVLRRGKKKARRTKQVTS